MKKLTLYDKIWRDHLVREGSAEECLIYIDRHLVHEVTSPQAFAGLGLSGRDLWRKDSILAMPDHNVPTTRRDQEIADPTSRMQIETLAQNCTTHEITYYNINDSRQGIVHVTGPEQGAILPGMTVACGDSHTSTNGAFAVFALGIGTSDVEHVLATQCLLLKKTKNMRITVSGKLSSGVSAKDIILSIIGTIGTAGATGYTIEYTGETIQNLSMEGRMTICNMSIEAGARAGMVAFDETTAGYLAGRPWVPQGDSWEGALVAWQDLNSDSGALFDKEFYFDAATVTPQVSWGTSPEMVVSVDDYVPDPATETDAVKAEGMRRALDYMDLTPGTIMRDIAIDKVFIGSCTNARIEDLRAAAEVIKGKKVAKNIKQALVVPGSGLVKQQAEQEQLNQIFVEAGFEWREPGCSMCLGMNDDILGSGERCASTSNRNFEGRQGRGGRTHLLSPAMAAAAAIAGHFVDVREVLSG